MIKIIYGGNVIAETTNIINACNLAKSYLDLMIKGQLEVKEMSIDIHQINPQTRTKTHRRIIIKESLPNGLKEYIASMPQLGGI
jgi:hypothetical protein